MNTSYCHLTPHMVLGIYYPELKKTRSVWETVQKGWKATIVTAEVNDDGEEIDVPWYDTKYCSSLAEAKKHLRIWNH